MLDKRVQAVRFLIRIIEFIVLGAANDEAWVLKEKDLQHTVKRLQSADFPALLSPRTKTLSTFSLFSELECEKN